MRLSRPVFIALVSLFVVALVVGAVLVLDGDGDEARAGAGATAPIAPAGVPLRPSCASDVPTEGLEIAEDRTVQLPTPAPDRFRPTSPERALAEFMDAWRDRAFDRMARWTTPSWREISSGLADQGRLLRERYGAFRLLGWTVLDEERGDEPSVRRFTVLTAYRDVAPRVQRERLEFVVNRENRDGDLVREGGRWGVFLAAAPESGPTDDVPAVSCTREEGRGAGA